MSNLSFQEAVVKTEYSIPQYLADHRRDHTCPLFFGTVICLRNRLIAITPVSEASVIAPPKFLRLAQQLCDGTRTINEVRTKLPRNVDGARFERFLDFLLEKKILIDGRSLTAHALQYGFQMSPFGVSAPPQYTEAISRRFHHEHPKADKYSLPIEVPDLADHYQDRISTYTFNHSEISLAQLSGLLWSLCGIVSSTHERLGNRIARRTIASAGALHLLEVYLVLQRKVDNYEPGIYRVRYPKAKCVVLHRMNGHQDLLPRAFAQPWHAQFATGAIFLAADITLAATRYRNRATQYVFMEAGAALQNGALSAPRVGLGFAQLGCYYESVVQDLCALDQESVLGSAVFGPLPTAAQLSQMRRGPDLDFAWIDTTSPIYNLPFYLARSSAKNKSPGTGDTWGIDPVPLNAYRKACAEAVERQGLCEPRHLRNACLRDLHNAMPPDLFVRYHKRQYAEKGFPFHPFSSDTAYWWKDGVEYASGRKLWIHADLVYPRSALTTTHDVKQPPITYATTSGAAAGVTEVQAFDRALYELVERDAFMRCWLAQSPGQAVATNSIPAAIRPRLKALGDAGCEIGIQLLPSSWSKVVMVWARHERNHFTTLGTAAHDDLETALTAALGELESRAFVWLNGYHPAKPMRPSSVLHTAHHFDLYGNAKYFTKANRILETASKAVTFAKLSRAHYQSDISLADRLATHGLSPIMVDITPGKCFIDQGRTQLSVVKAFVPSLVPLSFGYRLEPRGMLETVHRDSKFPHPFP